MAVKIDSKTGEASDRFPPTPLRLQERQLKWEVCSNSCHVKPFWLIFGKGEFIGVFFIGRDTDRPFT